MLRGYIEWVLIGYIERVCIERVCIERVCRERVL